MSASLPESLYISPLAEVTAVDEAKIALSVMGRRFTVEDPMGMLKRLLALAEQGVSHDAAVAALEEEFPAEAVTAAIKALTDTKVLVKRNDRVIGDATHYQLQHKREMEGLVPPAQAAAHAPSNWVLALAGQGACADAVAASMQQLGIRVERLEENAEIPANIPDYGQQKALLLVCADFENFGLFRQLNQRALARGIPSLYLGMDWSTVQCGPLVIPKASACYECYFSRVRGTRKFVAEFDVRSKRENILYHALPSKLAVQYGVAEASRMILHYLSGTLDNLHLSLFAEIDSQSGDIHRSRVLRLPRCPACGTANTARPVGSVFQQALLRRQA
jgi:bacteriocin biosynthesis cyclodehydratase domain-containing protein